ncbi:Snakin-1 [Nymphaea thermarum]|nr:Snakin-1 [Nymphaea thermarum]
MRPSSVAIILLVLLCLASSLQATLPDGNLCDMKCKIRCFKAAVKDRCIKYCGLCCAECKCVPSGTYGNKDECPCYRDKKSGSGKPKCP